MRMQKDSSFNRSFERENGCPFSLFGQNKLFQEPSLNRPNSIFKNGSFSMPFGSFGQRKDGKQPVNLFVELADDINEKNDDFINLNILQKCSSSMKPNMSVNKSVNERGRGIYNLRLPKDREGSIAQDDHMLYPDLFGNDHKKFIHPSSCTCNECVGMIGNNYFAHNLSFNQMGSELMHSPRPKGMIKEDSIFKSYSKKSPANINGMQKQDSVKKPLNIVSERNDKPIEETKINKNK